MEMDDCNKKLKDLKINCEKACEQFLEKKLIEQRQEFERQLRDLQMNCQRECNKFWEKILNEQKQEFEKKIVLCE
jgi:hypothetical protein